MHDMIHASPKNVKQAVIKDNYKYQSQRSVHVVINPYSLFLSMAEIFETGFVWDSVYSEVHTMK